MDQGSSGQLLRLCHDAVATKIMPWQLVRLRHDAVATKITPWQLLRVCHDAVAIKFALHIYTQSKGFQTLTADLGVPR